MSQSDYDTGQPTGTPPMGDEQPAAPVAPAEATEFADAPPEADPDADSAPDDAEPSPTQDPADEQAQDSIARERDEYLDALRRLQADFENYKKRTIKQQTEHLERAAGAFVEKLLPALDTADLALAHDDSNESLRQVVTALTDTLAKEGLERVGAVGDRFDPNEHDAVMHEPADDGEEHVIVDVMRAGWRYRGRVIRPAMVKVRG